MMLPKTILANLALNDDFSRAVFPHVKDEYFTGAERAVFELISNHIKKYNVLPTKETLSSDAVDMRKLADGRPISEEGFKSIVTLIDQFDVGTDNMEWKIINAEKYCQNKAIHNALQRAIAIYDGKDKNMDVGTIPVILTEALGVTFDSNIGHDFIDDRERRFKYYNAKEARIPFDVEILNTITKGGLKPKTLNMLLAGTGVGKSMAMCHFAASHITMGYDVLYITCEMAEEEISRRIDANLLNVSMDDLENIPWESYDRKFDRLIKNNVGRLKVKEYPTSSAHVGHFRHLLNELRLKEKFVPKIIYIDYLNICKSMRHKAGSVGSYEYIKGIAEELRGLAVEFKVPIMSATQTTRSGFASSDPGLDDTSESFGLPATADLFVALVSTDEFAEQGMIMGKQLKNRYSDLNKLKKFMLGVDKSHMRLFDVDQSYLSPPVKGGSQKSESDDTPLFDQSSSGKRVSSERRGRQLKKKPSFEDFT